jgi:hypothetical protein
MREKRETIYLTSGLYSEFICIDMQFQKDSGKNTALLKIGQ